MKIAIYARVSTEKQEKQETIQSQLADLRDYAKKNNLTIIDEYIDEGYSGELLDRPALDKLRDDAKKQIFEAILVHSPDRFSRKYIYLGLMQEELKKSGVSFIFLNRPDAKDTPEENLLNGVQGIIAEYEKEKIKERTRRGRLHKARSGRIVTSQAPYGYRYIREDKVNNITGHYEVNLSEAKIVKLIFDLFVNKKLSIRAIARELTKRNIAPQRGKQWRTSSLHRVIRNETYMGLAHYNKHIGCEPVNPTNNKYRRHKNTSMRIRPKEQWIPIKLPKEMVIIEERLFKQAQKQLQINSKMSPRNVKYQYLLRGLVKCANCEAPFYGEPCKGILYYRCGNRRRTFPLPRECKVPTVRTDVLESLVWDEFTNAIRNPRLIIQQLEKLKDKKRSKASCVKSDIDSIETQLSDLQCQEERLLDAYREQVLSVDQLKDQMDKTKTQRGKLEQERHTLQYKQENTVPRATVERSIRDYCKQVDRKLETIKDDFDSKRHLLTLALNRVIIDGKKVRIKGIIPTYLPEKPSSSNIASTVAGYYERNTSFEYELVACLA